MFNYSINWNRLIKENLPVFFHTLFRLNWIKALIKPFRQIYGEFTDLRAEYILKVAYNGQTNYLEKILNDTFDATLRRIYISDYGIVNQNWLFQLSELQPPIYLYQLYDSGGVYAINDYAISHNKVYKNLTGAVGTDPFTDVVNWVYYKDVTFFRQLSEYNITGGFIVNVPSALVYNNGQFNAMIDYYRLASRLYVINVF